jgi:flagellar hook assembly protein FlgD
MRTCLRVATIGMLLGSISCLNTNDPAERSVAATIEVPNTTLVNAPGATVEFTITATNSSDSPVTLQAASGCLLFYQIRSTANELVYNSLTTCTGAVVSETLDGGAQRTATFAWDGRSSQGSRVSSGSYLIYPGVALATGAQLGLPAPILVE